MSAIRAAVARLRGLFGGGPLDRELDEELAAHLDLATDDYVRRGMNQRDARRAALLEAGGVQQAREAYRDRRGIPLVESTIKDLSFAVRFLRNNPGLTASIVLTLAIGIGATTAVFSVANQVLFAPLPYREPDRIVDVNLVEPSQRGTVDWGSIASLELLEQARGAVPAVTDGMGISGMYPTIVRDGRRERLTVVVVTLNFSRFLGVAPVAGRSFLDTDDRAGAPPSAVVSAGYAARYLGGVHRALGQSLAFAGRTFPVVGVMPESFHVPNTVSDDVREIWVPIGAVMDEIRDARTSRTNMNVLLRLAPNVTADAAEHMLDPIVARTAAPGSPPVLVAQLSSLRHELSFQVRQPLWFLLGASATVLLIACANIASLVLARSLGRRREMSIRLALGASRARLVRQLLTECIVASLAGVIPGIVLAWLGVPLLVSLAGHSINVADFGVIHLSGLAILVAVSMAVISGIGIGVAPALAATRSSPARALQDGTSASGTGRSARATSEVLVALETALAIALLAGAALFVRSFSVLTRSNMGYDARVAVVRWSFAAEDSARPERKAAFSRVALDRARSVPGVVNVAIATSAPGTGLYSHQTVLGMTHAGVNTARNITTFLYTGDYFETLQIPLRRGVMPRASASEIALDQAAARRLFPNENPLGKTVVWGRDSTRAVVSAIVGDVLDDHVDPTVGRVREATAHMYVPSGAQPLTAGMVLARSVVEPARTAAELHEAVAAIDGGVIVDQGGTLGQIAGSSRERDRLVVVLASWFGAIGLFLAALGMYAVVSHATRRRTRELGVRMALGAQRGNILSLTMTRTLIVVSAGAALGVAAALLLGRVVRRLLFGVSPADPSALGAAVVLFLGVALVATYLPSRRATRLDPVRALRED